MSSQMDFIDFVNYSRIFRNVGPRRYLRDYSDPFDKYSIEEFRARYRFSPDVVKNVILPLIESDLNRPTKRGLPFAPEIMLLLTLRYFATGSFQKLEGDVMNICQQSVSRIVSRVSKLIAIKMQDFVKFPATLQGVNTAKQQFYEIAHFPGVIGCIDCTHVKIRSPGGITSEVYRNRKGWFSINVQAVTGPNLEFYDLVARWPGSTHDSFIYNSSAMKQRLTSGELGGIILGDSGYAVSNVLLTPFLSPNSIPQQNYNKSQIKTRNTIERAFGIWKRRFPCLQLGMGVKVETVVAIICACAALHNIALLTNDLVPPNWETEIESEVTEISESDITEISENRNNSGFLMRQALVERFFTS